MTEWTSLLWSLNIDFLNKNNSKRGRPDTKIQKVDNWSTQNKMPSIKRPQNQSNVRWKSTNMQKNPIPLKEKEMTSEAFLRHLSKKNYTDFDDPTKLIKKWEKPVKIWSLMWWIWSNAFTK